MTDRWQVLEELVQAALDLPTDGRERWLAEATDDLALRLEALELARAYDQAGDFLEGSARLPAEPSAIGPYRVLRRLGSGGMGEVYLASRDDQDFERKVAVKVLAPGLYSRDFVRRFRAERQILARLDHPNIARLHEGGTHCDGRPYLAMEHVEGAPLHHFCDERRLGLHERVELILAVCSAVDYAHRNLVLHLDLKPENILVGDDGTPKLLDFGIAKLLTPGSTTLTTRSGARPLTPSYASPEQHAGGPLTTASDVYSLGVVLYRLLSGVLPHVELDGQLEPIRVLASEAEPCKPSAARATSSDAKADELERLHALLRRQLRGDLDAIILKALRREPEGRYETVGQLAEDLRRHRQGQPVLARRGTFRYRAGKLARRHKGALVTAVLGVALLVGFSVAMALQAARLEQERIAAEQQRRKAEMIALFLVDIIGNTSLDAGGHETTVHEALDYGLTLLDQGRVYASPEIDAALRVVLARIFHAMGRHDVAEPLLQRSLAERVAWNGEDHLDVAEVLHQLGWMAAEREDFVGARELFGRALVIRERDMDPADTDLAATRLAMGRMVHRLEGYASAVAYYDAAIAPLSASATTTRELLDLAILRHRRARAVWVNEPERSVAEYEALVEMFDSLDLPAYPDLPVVLGDLAAVYCQTGRPRDAEAVNERALAIMEGAIGVSPARQVPLLVGLARAQYHAGDLEANVRTLLRALEVAIASFGVEHPETQRIAGWLRLAYAQTGQAEDLAALERRVPPPAVAVPEEPAQLPAAPSR